MATLKIVSTRRNAPGNLDRGVPLVINHLSMTYQTLKKNEETKEGHNTEVSISILEQHAIYTCTNLVQYSYLSTNNHKDALILAKFGGQALLAPCRKMIRDVIWLHTYSSILLLLEISIWYWAIKSSMAEKFMLCIIKMVVNYTALLLF